MRLIVLGHLHEADVAHLQVRRHRSRPEQLRHSPLHEHLLEEKREEAVLRLRVA